MSHIDMGMWGVVAFSLGGAVLMFTFYQMLDNVGKPWIDQGLLLWFWLVPLGFVAFFMLGWGLLMIMRARDKIARL